MTNQTLKIRTIGAAYAQAWCSHAPEAVAAFFAVDGQIRINNGDVHKGHAALAAMAASFFADFPDLRVLCDDVRSSGTHVLFSWTLEGRHVTTKNVVRVGGWEEWELDENLKVKSSLGWFDAVEYQRQIDDGL